MGEGMSIQGARPQERLGNTRATLRRDANTLPCVLRLIRSVPPKHFCLCHTSRIKNFLTIFNTMNKGLFDTIHYVLCLLVIELLTSTINLPNNQEKRILSLMFYQTLRYQRIIQLKWNTKWSSNDQDYPLSKMITNYLNSNFLLCFSL